MVGSLATARKSIDAHNAFMEWTTENGWRPGGFEHDGFRYIGSGCTRTAYLHIKSNVVYKVGVSSYNEQEGWASKKFRGWHEILGYRVMIPPVTVWTVFDIEYDTKVAAMPFYSDDEPNVSLAWGDTPEAREVRSRGWYDLHNFNMRKHQDGVVVIDLGGFSEDPDDEEDWSIANVDDL
jgi:hypothetical protein